ncbi:MAG TPA: 4Fe-4S binding protein [Tepidisphaeraceae bacterium]|jgi:hypothetical protein|nr:4Fe-4S binding protein [Tepidisphaeraceae bacterium]
MGIPSKQRHPLPVLAPNLAPRAKAWPTARAILLGLYRLTIVAAIVWIIHRHHVQIRIDADAPIRAGEVQPFLPQAASLKIDESDRLGLFVRDASGRDIGYVLRTAPISNGITGYVGPTDTLIVLGPDMRVVGISIRSSSDTAEHVEDVAHDDYFMKLWNGKTWDQVAGTDPKTAGIEGVSGASLTSLAIANGIQHRFQHSTQLAAREPHFRLGWADFGVLAVLAVALLFTFTHLRRRTWVRRAFQVVLIGYLGLWNGRLIAVSLLGGWAESSVPWRIASGLVLLVTAALLLPWTTRRAVYCSHVCPHGAAQEWMGRLVRVRLRLPPGVDRGLRWIALLLIAFAIFVVMIDWPVNLAAIEPFDAYSILHRIGGIATIAIAVGSLIAAAFVPMAYCKYGCPTGAILSFVRSHGKADRFGRKDIAGALLLMLTIALHVKYGIIHRWLFGA